MLKILIVELCELTNFDGIYKQNDFSSSQCYILKVISTKYNTCTDMFEGSDVGKIFDD